MSESVHKLSVVPDLHAGSDQVRVLIADDHPLIIAGIRRTIEHLDDIEIVGEAGAVCHPPCLVAGSPGPADRTNLPDLTDRERSILTAVASGMTTPAISSELWISEHTVKFHLTSIYRKLGVANRAGAVRYALEHHLVAV